MSLAYVIDGYNLIKHPLLAGIIKKAVSGRQGSGNEQLALLQVIRGSRLTGSPRNSLVIVFDGYSPGFPCSDGSGEIVYSCDISADDHIVRLVEQSPQPKNIIVVSDDRQVQAAAQVRGALTLSVEEFCGKGAEPKASRGRQEQEDMGKLSYNDMERINRELRDRWLK